MIVKTDPSIPRAEQILSGYKISKETYSNAVTSLKESGYLPKSVIVKRRAIPPFPLGIPLKIVADWDAQVDGIDALVLLREYHEHEES